MLRRLKFDEKLMVANKPTTLTSSALVLVSKFTELTRRIHNLCWPSAAAKKRVESVERECAAKLQWLNSHNNWINHCMISSWYQRFLTFKSNRRQPEPDYGNHLNWVNIMLWMSCERQRTFHFVPRLEFRALVSVENFIIHKYLPSCMHHLHVNRGA